jgi:hypothetical protein
LTFWNKSGTNSRLSVARARVGSAPSIQSGQPRQDPDACKIRPLSGYGFCALDQRLAPIFSAGVVWVNGPAGCRNRPPRSARAFPGSP